MRTLAVINHKGGAGKTTTSVNLAAAIGETGTRVLLIDLDPQGSASEWVGAHDDSRGMFDVFVGTVEFAALAQRTIVPGVDIVPASPWLVTAERTLMGDLAAAFVRAVGRLPANWDIVIADCPPVDRLPERRGAHGVPRGAHPGRDPCDRPAGRRQPDQGDGPGPARASTPASGRRGSWPDG